MTRGEFTRHGLSILVWLVIMPLCFAGSICLLIMAAQIQFNDLTRLSLAIGAVCILMQARHAARRIGQHWAVLRNQETLGRYAVILRSFKDDELPFDQPEWLAPSESCAEVVAVETKRLGLVPIVIREPGGLPPLGPVSIDAVQTEWRKHVAALIESATAIIVMINTSEGLTWEMSHLAKSAQLSRTLFVVPPVVSKRLGYLGSTKVSLDQMEHRWREFARVAQSTGIYVPVEEPVHRLDDGSYEILVSFQSNSISRATWIRLSEQSRSLSRHRKLLRESLLRMLREHEPRT